MGIILNIFTGINILLYLYIVVAVGKRWGVSKAHRKFLFLAIFSLCWIIIRASENLFLDIWAFLIQLDFAFAALVAWQLALFAKHFPDSDIRLTSKKEILIFLPILVLIILSFTNIFFKIEGYQNIDYSIWYFLYIGTLIYYFFFIGAKIFFFKYFKFIGLVRQQLAYILLGYVIAISLLLYDSVYTAVIGPRVTDLDILFFNASILFSAIVAYAMLRYRFMDIRVIIRRGTIYGVTLLLTLALYTYLALTLKTTIEKNWAVSPTWTAIILIALVALGFPPLKSLVEKAVNTLFKGRKSIDLAVREVREKIAKKTDLETLVDLICNEIKQYLDVTGVKMYIVDHKEQRYVLTNDDEEEKIIELKNDLIRYFEKYSAVLVRDEIPHLREEHPGAFEREMLQKAEKEMKRFGSGLAMPLRTEDEIFGVLFIGQRTAWVAYTVQDIQYLERLREQVTFTLANALLYREAMARVQMRGEEMIRDEK